MAHFGIKGIANLAFLFKERLQLNSLQALLGGGHLIEIQGLLLEYAMIPYNRKSLCQQNYAIAFHPASSHLAKGGGKEGMHIKSFHDVQLARRRML